MNLRDILERFREQAQNERDKGTSFENLCRVFFLHDAIQSQLFDQVWSYEEWAKLEGLDGRDRGIDLVARNRSDGTFTAIQCKFYKEGGRVSQGEIASFLANASKAYFTRRIIIDTTGGDWGENAEALLEDQDPPVTRIGLEDIASSDIDWSAFYASDGDTVSTAAKKSLRPHQSEALQSVRDGFLEADRGKLIMACGTGKTFTGLKIAEDLAGAGKKVLFMVPSLSLMSQTVREWNIDKGIEINCFAVCSDAQVGKKRASGDYGDIQVYDLAYPATTDPEKLALEVAKGNPDAMTVVFSTYHSVETISKAQLWHNLPDFDLIICDEAHRTTGAIFEDEDQSHFTKIHNNGIVAGKKRLYMTATPRVYGEGVKQKAGEASVELCSMDDESIYGEVLFSRGFSWAVENNLLTDYKVIVLAVDEGSVSEGIQRALVEDSELKLDDATKMIGCYKALTKQDLADALITDREPMRRALAFCKDIKTSKLVTRQFKNVVDDYLDTEVELTGESDQRLRCELDHVDGTFNAKKREALLSWLKEDTEASCRILSNARCLSEGVDVPALDAILFLHPRKSQIDVVQSVGRVMRRTDEKKLGYVILPVAIPSGVSPEDALKDNERYKVVWQILNALRSHDERMDATINRIGYGEDVSDKIEIIAVSNTIPSKKPAKAETAGIGKGSDADDDDTEQSGSISKQVEPEQYGLWIDEFAAGIRAKIVKKCGTKTYWEDWAGDIARIAEVHITRIEATLAAPNTPERAAFDAFLEELRDDLNPEVSEGEAIEMLAQHIITKPVFDAMFEEHSFSKTNAISKALDGVLAELHADSLEGERETLERFYGSVKRRAAGLKTAEAKQKVIVQLYDSFFRNAFPKLTKKLGIVYTPVEVVDFIIHSVNDVLKSEFGQTLGSKGVHILDPFAGTGTFVTRLLQSGLIKPEELEHKYKHEIHANEIVLLAYYIAAINIEAVYHDIAKENAVAKGENGEGMPYAPFDGIVLTDTFQLYEQDKDMIADLLPDNSERRTAQKERDIRVIMGNPPYLAGKGTDYPNSDASIRKAYADASKAVNKNALYDSYIRAIRWATDRILDTGEDRGVVAYVSNAGWVDGNAMDGMRKCLAEEFSSLYVFHLRGNQRTVGEESRKEGGKIFGSGSRAPIAISVLVRNPDVSEFGKIYYHDIGDYLDQKEKLALVQSYKSVDGLGSAKGWTQIEPDKNFDWVGQGEKIFGKFIEMGNKADKGHFVVFENYSNGAKTNSDAWMYNSSRALLVANMQSMITTYNDEVGRFEQSDGSVQIEEFVDANPKTIKWHSGTLPKAKRGIKGVFSSSAPRQNLYRPFGAEWLYYDPMFIQRVAQLPKIFPTEESKNLVISVTGVGSRKFSCLLSGLMPCLDMMEKGQCFPLKLYEPANPDDGLFAAQDNETGYTERDGISDAGLKHFKDAYAGEDICKEDLFYYIYGLLHSPDYRARFKNNLSKELPRIPAVKTAADFWAFSKAGRALGDLHVNYETVEPYPVVIKEGDLRLASIDDPEVFYRVEKMKFGGKGRNKDKTIVHYNPNITLTGIPIEAYEYVVNGKSALDWVVERQCVKTDKASGIVNDANRYAIETVGNPAYPLELFQRVITVSLETMKIVRGLPKLDID